MNIIEVMIGFSLIVCPVIAYKYGKKRTRDYCFHAFDRLASKGRLLPDEVVRIKKTINGYLGFKEER